MIFLEVNKMGKVVLCFGVIKIWPICLRADWDYWCVFITTATCQSIARGLFQLSRQDREFLPFSLMLRVEIETFFNFFSSTSRVSRREQDFFYSNLVFPEGDENLKINSQGRARKNLPNSHKNF